MFRKLTLCTLILGLSACATTTSKPTEVLALDPNTPACPIDIPANTSDEDLARLLLAKRPDLASDVQGFGQLLTACGATVQVQRIPLG